MTTLPQNINTVSIKIPVAFFFAEIENNPEKEEQSWNAYVP